MSNMAEDLDAQEEDPKFETQAFGADEEEDYSDERGGVPIRCQFCVGQKFRRSRLRSDDFKSLLLMRYPVRCLRCSQRQLVSFTIAGISLASHVRPQRKRRSVQQKTGGQQKTGAEQRAGEQQGIPARPPAS